MLVDTGAVQRADGAGDHRGLRTPPYTAPEVLANPGRRRDVATDLYSLGAVAFFLLTGQPPPNAERADYEAEARAVVVDCHQLPTAHRADVTEHLMRLLASDPAARSVGPSYWA